MSETRVEGIVLDSEIEQNNNMEPGLSCKTIKNYFCSNDGKELLFYIVMLGIPTIILSAVHVKPYDRPLPYQQLSADSAKNLVYDLDEDGETFSTTLDGIIVFAVFLIQVALSYKFGYVGDVHATLCVYVVAVSLTIILTDALKNYCGYLRPIFFHTCEPDFSTGQCTKDSTDVRKSFPSGHSSVTFCFMVLLSAYLGRQFGVSHSIIDHSISAPNDPNRNEVVVSYKVKIPTSKERFGSLVSFLPLVFALFVAGSRVHDNFHHPADIVGGAALGTGIALYFHRIWFPSVIPAGILENYSPV